MATVRIPRCARLVDGAADHRLMAEMHTVEEPDRDDARHVIERERVAAVHDVHARRLSDARYAGAKITSGRALPPSSR